jgi:hypothetical protein
MDEQYWNHPGVNHSTLKAFSKGAARVKHQMENGTAETEAMRLGTLAHLCVLEPHLVPKHVAVAPEVSKRTKIGKEKWKEFEQDNADKMVFTKDQYDTAVRMSESVHNHPVVKELFQGSWVAETECYWKDDLWGIDCKCKVDAIVEKTVMVDLKTTIDATPAAFGRQIFNYFYHTQAAWYSSGAARCGYPITDFFFVAVEKTAPFEVCVFKMSRESLDLGRKTVLEWLGQFYNRKKNDYWISYDQAVEVDPPAWLLKENH